MLNASDLSTATAWTWANPIVIVAIGTQLCLLVAAVGQVFLASFAAAERKDATRKIEAVALDTVAIKGHVDGEKTAAEGRENALRQENVLLREMLETEKHRASLLAQAAAQAAGSSGERRAIVPSTELHLSKIEANTAATVAALKPGAIVIP